MRIGTGTFFVALGAILTFATNWHTHGLNFHTTGVILMLVGSWYVNITIFLAVGAALERTGPKLIDYPPGILERTEALIFFVVLAMVEASPLTRPLGPYLCYAMTLLEIATGAQRLLFGVQMLRAR